MARFGKESSAISAATAYDMTTLILMAIKNGARTSSEIRDSLLDVKDYEGYSNTINFDEKGQVSVPTEEILIKRIRGNKPVEIA